MDASLESLGRWFSTLLDIEGPETAIAILLLARIFPVAAFTPWLAFRGTPWLARLAVVATLTVAFAALLPLPADIAPTGAQLAAMAVHELVLGSLFALASSVPFLALRWAGALVDRWRAPLRWPLDESPLAKMFAVLAVAIFWALGGATLALTLFSEGLGQVPLGGLVTLRSEAFLSGTLRATASALGFGLAFASPGAAALILYDVIASAHARSTVSGTTVAHPVFRSLAGLWGGFLLVAVMTPEFIFLTEQSMGTAVELMAKVGDSK